MIKPQDLGCFQSVAKVLGEEEAEKQLSQVLVGCCLQPEQEELLGAFDFISTPQGFEYWVDVWRQTEVLEP